MLGGPYSSGKRETSGSFILPTTSIGRVVRSAEDFAFAELVPAAVRLIHQRRAEGVRPAQRDILRGAEIVAFIVAPDGNTGFIGVVENVAAADGVFRRRNCDRSGSCNCADMRLR